MGLAKSSVSSLQHLAAAERSGIGVADHALVGKIEACTCTRSSKRIAVPITVGHSGEYVRKKGVAG